MRWIRTALIAALTSLGCDVTGLLDEPRMPAQARSPATVAPVVKDDLPRAARADPDHAPIRSPQPRGRDMDARPELAEVMPSELCVTRGDLADRTVEVPTFRAIAAKHGGDAATMRFVVRGATEKTRALASGQARRQLGLKLRAQDGCNLIYVMWRLDPRPQLDVSVKRNPGAKTAKECGAHGYTKVKQPRMPRLPALEEGSQHELRAEILDEQLVVTIDGIHFWEGRLPASAAGLEGPAGIRSDNIAFDLVDFRVDGKAATADVTAKCVTDESD